MKTCLRALLLALIIAPLAGAESFDSWSAKARKALKRKDYAQAADDYDKALALWRKDDGKKAKAQALIAQAGACEDSGDIGKAAVDLGAALAIETKDARLFHRRGALYLKLSKPSEALADFYKAVSLDVTYAEAYYDRGRAYELQGDAGFAREDYGTACKLGFKKSCPADHKSKPKSKPKLKPKSKPAASPAPAPKTASMPAPMPEPKPAPEPAPEKPVDPPAAASAPEPTEPAAAPAAPNMAACGKAIKACVKRGNGYGACVRKAKPCGERPKKGCCPESCAQEFARRAGEDASEAAVFREVFSAGGACGPAKP
jgi:tetratricopeptide (TPR) repeat protein